MTDELNLTDEQRANLKQLADYLSRLPENYRHFDMESYLSGNGIVALHHIKGREQTYLEGCNTVACAVGHAVAAGIPIPENCDSWIIYASLCLTGSEGGDWGRPLFNWCFSEEWANVDNTPQGAADRIYWMLEHGVPENWHQQMMGYDDLCYE